MQLLLHPEPLLVGRIDKSHATDGALARALVQLFCGLPVADEGDEGDDGLGEGFGGAHPAATAKDGDSDDGSGPGSAQRFFHYAETPHEISLVLADRDARLGGGGWGVEESAPVFIFASFSN